VNSNQIRKRTVLPLIGAVVAAGLPILVAALVAIGWLIRGQERLIEDDFRSSARAVLSAVDSQLQGDIAVAQALAQTPELKRGDLDAFYDHARVLIAHDPRWSMIILNDREGKEQILNSSRARNAHRPARETGSLIAAIRSRAPVVGPVTSQVDAPQNLFFPIRVPVFDGDTVKWVLTVLIRPDRIAQVVERQGEGGRIAAVLDQDARIVARTGSPDASGQVSTSLARREPGKLYVGRGIDGRRYARVALQSPTTGWWAAIGMSYDDYYAPIRRSIWDVLLLAAGAGLVSITLFLIVSRRIRVQITAAEAERAREMEQAYRATSAALSAAEAASAEKSRFLAAASHDLRQPLQAMQNLAHLLVSRVTGDSVRLARQLQVAIGSSSALLNALLDVTKLDSGTIAPNVQSVPLRELIDPIAADFQNAAAAKGLKLKVVGCRQSVRTDSVLLGSIVRNLISNAIRYTLSGRVLVGCRLRGRSVRIEVWDTGIGIPEGEQQAIFEDFRQVGNVERSRDKGYGLGLAIVQRLGALLGHPVGLRSSIGKGTVFWVEVPMASDAALRPEQPIEANGLLESGRVLIVEDDVVQGMSLSMMLGEWGFEAPFASTIAEAMALAEQAKPDLILTDFRLREGGDGLEAIRRIRERVGSVPAVVVSGEAALSQTLRTVGIPLLLKPYTSEQLRAVVRDNLRIGRAA
jgi:signal transduction histidine kinase/CheY-like chemotaxis protein